MFRIVQFGLEDIKALLEEPMNAHVKWWKANDYAYVKHLSRSSLALTGVIDDKVLICGFFIEIWNGRGYAVILLGEEIKKHSVAVYRGMRQFLPTLPFDRVEFDSPCDFDLGHRRAKFLGFDLMCERAKKYLPDGSDAAIYEWVRA